MRASLWLPSMFLVTCFLAAAAAGAAPLSRVEIRGAEARALAAELNQAGFDVLDGTVTERTLELVASDEDLAALRARGLELRVLEIGRPFREIQAERGEAPGVGGVPPGYSSLAAINASLAATAADHPSICAVHDLTAELGVAPTVQGRHLMAIKVSDQVGQDEDEPAFLLVAAYHSREIVTPVIALNALDQLVNGYGVDPGITAIVDEHEIWIAPVWNPDGYEHVFNVDNLWRKNRRVFAQGIGVDLNRNYPQGWSNPCAGSTNPSSETYKGPSAASEAETQTMIAWSLARRFAKVLDYHSFAREVLHGYACWTHPFDTYFTSEAIQLSNLSGYAGAHRAPSADGEHYEWQFALSGAHAFLIETHIEFQPPYASAVTEATQLWPGIRWMLEHPIPLRGHVTDSVTGDPVSAAITYPGITFTHGEQNQSFAPEGRYHAFLPPGSYTVRFEAEDYEPFVATGVQVTGGSSTVLDVALVPSTVGVADGAQTPRLEPIAVRVAGPLARPAFEYTLAEQVPVMLRLYAVRGGLVRTLVDDVQAAGRHAIPWNGRDDRGREVAAGGYYYLLTSPAGLTRGKLVLAR